MRRPAILRARRRQRRGEEDVCCPKPQLVIDSNGRQLDQVRRNLRT
jgi:hypothetical protein